MTQTDQSKNATHYKIAVLTAIACVLQISESMIPHPVPGLRLGMANMITLVALVTMGFRPAMEIAVLRTLLSSLIIGTFMSPTFILSLAGAVISTLAMGFFMWIARVHRNYGPSIIGISIVGALIHNLVQLYLAYLLLVRHGGIFVFLPWLCVGALLMGWITGTVAGSVCKRLSEYRPEKSLTDTVPGETDFIGSYHYKDGSSLIHGLPPEFKIGAMICLSLLVLAINDFTIFACLFLLLALIIVVSRISCGFLLLRLTRFTSLILIAFLLPIFFNQGTQVAFKIAGFAVTQEGVLTGSIIAMRIVFLILASAIVVRTTSPDALSRGLARVLFPIKYIGISEKRTATILSLAWTALPVIWHSARNAIKNSNFSRSEKLCNLIPILSKLICELYMETENDSFFWKNARHGAAHSVMARGKDGPEGSHQI